MIEMIYPTQIEDQHNQGKTWHPNSLDSIQTKNLEVIKISAMMGNQSKKVRQGQLINV
jgi:hypothetical protein